MPLKNQDPNVVLSGLRPCKEGLEFALKYESIGGAIAALTDPSWYLWLFLAATSDSQSNKAKVTRALLSLSDELLLSASAEARSAYEECSKGLREFSADHAKVPAVPVNTPGQEGDDAVGVAAMRLAQQVSFYAQSTTRVRALRDITSSSIAAISSCAEPLGLLRKYLTAALWEEISQEDSA